MWIRLVLSNSTGLLALDRINLSSAIICWRKIMHEFFFYTLKAIKPYKNKLITLSVCCLCTSLINLFIPLLSGDFFDKMVETPKMNTILEFGILLFLINIVNMILNYSISILNISIQVKSSYELNKCILEKLSKVDILELSKMNRTYLNQRINNDVNTVIIFIIGLIKDIIINAVTLLISFIILLKVNITTGIIFLIILLFYVALYKYIRQIIIKLQTELLEKKSQYFSKLQDLINYIKFTKIYSYDSFLLNSLNKKYNEMYSCMIKNQKYAYSLSTSEQVILLFSQLFLYIICGYKVIKGTLTIGIFVIMSSYFNNIVRSIKYFSSLYQQYLSAFAGYKRLKEVEQLRKDCSGKIKMNKVDVIQLKNISYTFNEIKIFDNINLDFKKNNIYMICGRNGVGKSTIINIILGLYTSYRGRIFFDSIEARNVDLYDLRKNHISYVDQSPILINSTVKENLCLNNIVSLTKLKKCLQGFKLIDINDDVEKFLSKNINELNSNVSGGEAQKICIIRELIRNKEIMIFDEPTSKLDSESKIYFINKIKKIKKDHIIIIITHDSEMIKSIGENIIQW